MAHRLFPAAVALWCAALAGMGCLAASADALAGLVGHLHLATVLPAAAPPLGLTARLMLAIVLAAAGGMAGLAIGLTLHRRAGGTARAWPVRNAANDADEVAPARYATAREPADSVTSATAPRVRNRDAHPDAPPRRPLVVTTDVLPFAATSAFVTPDPQPAGDDMSPADRLLRDDFDALDAHDPAASLPPFLAAAFAAVNTPLPPVVAPVPSDPVPSDPVPSDPALSDKAPAVLVAEPVAVVPDAPAAADSAAVTPAVTPAPATITDSPAAVADIAAPARPGPAIHRVPLASLAATAPQAPIAQAPLASLGLVQLIERLALAIAERQARQAAASAADTSAASRPIDPRMPLHRFDPLTMDPPGPLLRAKPARPAGTGDAAAADHATRFAASALTSGPVSDPGDGAELSDPYDDADIEQRYSSLTGMTLQRPELVPTDLVPSFVSTPVSAAPASTASVHDQAEPWRRAPDAAVDVDGDTDAVAIATPVVPFRLSAARAHASVLAGEPAPRATVDADTADADRALRDALATLRKMSGQR